MVEEEGKSQWVAELLRPRGDTRALCRNRSRNGNSDARWGR